MGGSRTCVTGVSTQMRSSGSMEPANPRIWTCNNLVRMVPTLFLKFSDSTQPCSGWPISQCLQNMAHSDLFYCWALTDIMNLSFQKQNCKPGKVYTPVITTSGVQTHCWLHSKLEASLHYMRPCLNSSSPQSPKNVSHGGGSCLQFQELGDGNRRIHYKFNASQ